MSERPWSQNVEGAFEGFTHFWAETGTEGGYWAIQDRAFIQKKPPNYGFFAKHIVFDPETPEREGEVLAVEHLDGRPLPDPMIRDTLWQEKPEEAEEKWGRRVYGVGQGDILMATIRWADGKEDIRRSDSVWTQQWDYDGLHVLKDGDRLVIFEEDGETVKWSGVINLEQFELFAEDAKGLWIHAAQIDEDRDVWADLFFRQHPCRLWTS